MKRNVFTARDLEALENGSRVSLPADAVVTPLAREEAARRGITIHREPGSDAKAPSPSGTAGQMVAIGADHGGFELKEWLKEYLRAWGFPVLDCGTDSSTAVDYPDFAERVATAVAGGRAWRGVVIDSAGVGSSIAANKVPGARAALCFDRATARNSREHNDANILSLGAKFIAPEAAREILALWLDTPYAGGRHQRRLDKIRAIEERHSRAPGKP